MSPFQVMGMDPSLEESADNLRSQMLQLIGLDDLGDDTFYRPPDLQLVLEQILCTHCLLNVDLDLSAARLTNEQGELDPERGECGASFTEWLLILLIINT